MIMRPDLRGAKACASYLQISLRTLWVYAAQSPDPLPLFKFGGTCVASRRDLDAWLSRQLRAVTLPNPVRGGRRAKRRRVVAVP